MTQARPFPDSPADLLRRGAPETPILCFSPAMLRETAQTFLDGFPGQVTYAVKANPEPAVLENLAAAGIGAFDVASLSEIDLVRAVAPTAGLHYNNPVRSGAEIARAVARGVRSFSLDSAGELARLVARVPAGAELTVRYKLPVKGAAYDFGAKFGAEPAAAAELLRAVAEAGYTPSLTFHPGTQCAPPEVWRAYVAEAAAIARAAAAEPARLNVGGGFPSHRMRAAAPDLGAIFEAIDSAATAAFGAARPALVCEPGRGMVAECCTLMTRVRALRDDHVFLDDGIYGGLAEMLSMPMTDRIEVRSPEGLLRTGAPVPRTVFGPTCDSLDRLPGHPMLPEDTEEDDAVLFRGMGAYSGVTATRFNGFGALTLATVDRLDD
ncbi:type III PLP-dependent enzyme [Rhodovulum sp. 12E13]|uniref:type III PLP-dependent enzyme n=1 Tax=Rhodovulum sp. 12E13 TaxID=2203891 RepID=UPI000E14A67A|nr:type III PLP-dependent enzyme [Rhodovulum sp. 12E13]RDC72513.1 type III PLP-dependent enzyme [Rhodovulum sp. 12E13]